MAALKVSIIFGIVLILIKRNVNMGLSMILGGLAFSFAFIMQPKDVVLTVFTTITSYSTIRVVLALVLVNWLERFMRHTGRLGKMIEALKKLSGDPRASLALLPAILGLLPSPGGAKFSAPMVEEVANGLDVSADDKTFINYWYRHLWEYTFPLYPALILAAELLKVPVGQFAMYNIPFTIIAILLGIPFGLAGIKVKIEEKQQGYESWKEFIKGILPIITIIVLVIGIKIDVNLSLGIVLIWLIFESKFGLRALIKELREGISLKLLLLVFGTMFFKEMLVISGGMEGLILDIKKSGIPDLAVLFALPFSVGLLTGLALPMVSVCFPIVAALAWGNGTNLDWALASFAFVSGFSGVMLSPVHLCFILSVDHFKANFNKVYRRVWIPQGIMILALLIYYWILKFIA